MARIRTVLFDLFDTLAQLDPPILRAGRARVAERAGVSEERLLAYLRETSQARREGRLGNLRAELAHMLTACGVADEDGRLARALADLELEVWQAGVRAYEDSVPTLRALRAAGVRVGIVSNCTSQAGAMAAALGLEQEVDDVVLSCQVGLQKPDPAIYRLALARLGAEGEERGSLLVDDQPENLDSAREALGMQTAHIVRPGLERPDSNGHPHIADLEAVLGLVAVDGVGA